MGALLLCFLAAMDELVDLLHCTTDEVCEHLFETAWRGHSDGFTAREACDLADKSIDESMQDNECDNGDPAKMSSSDDFFSENIQVDLDDPGIWKAKGHPPKCQWRCTT
eukprot:scaffold276000_cov75-Attheya_sp.AAC.2